MLFGAFAVRFKSFLLDLVRFRTFCCNFGANHFLCDLVHFKLFLHELARSRKIPMFFR